jgi:hypothetical protein
MSAITPPHALATAAAAIGLVGFVAFAPHAQAGPFAPLPLAPECAQFAFDGPIELAFQNSVLRFDAVGTAASVPAKIGVDAEGSVDATITGRDIQVKFTQNNANKDTLTLIGTVDNNGLASGAQPVPWLQSAGKGLSCTVQGEPKMEPQQAGTVTVLKDSDVYDAPEGAGNRLEEPFFLDNDRVLATVQPCADNWCLLAIPDLPGGAHGNLPAGQAWVYSGEDFLKVG